MAGLLGDVFSAADTAKRKLKGLLADPVGTLQQFVGNENDRAGQFNQLTADAAQETRQTGKLYGPKSQQLAGLLAEGYNPAAMFIGASAKTWDKAAADKAQSMLKKGADPKQVWKETGTFKGADGALRQEIPDNLAQTAGDGFLERMVDPATKNLAPSEMPLMAWLNHKPLEDAYGYRVAKGVKATPDVAGGGSYDPTSGTISLSVFGDNKKSTTLHEIQHAIQQREGWAKGGSPESFPEVMPYDKLVKRNYNMQDVYVRAKANGGVDPETGTSLQAAENAVNELTKQVKGWKSPDDLYRSLAGEAEARATQARMNMNAEQRREVYPFDSYDVPVDQLIVRGGLLGEAKSIPQAPQAAALETARKNAVKMLGLAENNTPMDRAKALGFDTDAFHATGADFRSFVPSPYRGAVSVAATPQGAKAGGLAGAADGTGTGANNIMPLLMKSDGIQGLRLEPKQIQFLQSLPEKATEAEVDALMSKAPKGSYWGNFFDEVQQPDGAFAYVRKSEPKVSFADIQKTHIGADGRRIPNWGDERYVANRIAADGGKGWIQADEAGASASIIDPSILRSRFAAFDPARVNESDLLGGATLPMLGLLGAGAYGLGSYMQDK